MHRRFFFPSLCWGCFLGILSGTLLPGPSEKLLRGDEWQEAVDRLASLAPVDPSL